MEGSTNQNGGNSVEINSRMSIYNFNEKNCTLIVNETVSNITVNGSGNKILARTKIPNIIINGSRNEINVSPNIIQIEHNNSYISNVIFNGNYNSVICTRKNCNFMKIDNGNGNKITIGQQNTSSSTTQSRAQETNFPGSGFNQPNNNNNGNNNNFRRGNFPNNFTSSHQSNVHSYTTTNQTNSSNYSIRINNGQFDSNIFEIFNNLPGNLNMNIQFNNDPRQNNFRSFQTSNVNNFQNVNPHNYQNENFTSESDENSIVSLNLDNQEEEEEPNAEFDEEAYRQIVLQKRGEVIEELNVFQFKHSSKFVGRVEDTCAICLEKFKSSDLCKQFSCTEHMFHKKCLESWLKTSNFCPLCKHDLMDDILVEDS